MKVAFLQDFFDNEIIGGAEKNDSALLNYLINKKKKRKIVPVHTYKIGENFDKYDFYVISNFVRLPTDIKLKLIDKKNYIIYEHDHKYVVNRNPAVFKDFIAPPEKIINREFYNSAKKVFVLSKICKQVIEKNLEINNVHNIGCSLWSQKDLDLIKQISHTSGKASEYGILQSSNTIKGTLQAIQYCNLNNIEPKLVSSPNYAEFITNLSLCEKFIFFPQVLETYSRVCAEAKMLNCKVITTPKLIGFFSEDYSKLSGNDLHNKICINIEKAVEKFEEEIYG